MLRRQEVSTPIYRQVAIDIAKSIATGKYVRGQKLFGRSVLASQYGVSPETIRKAVFLLKDMGILDTEKGSGIEIVSAEKAVDFIDRYREIEHVASLKTEITQWVRDQEELTDQILNKIQHLISAAEKLNTVSPLNPYQIEITANCSVLGKTVSEVQFWHNTGGTIIAVRRGETLIVSPGPYATFYENDILYIVGDHAVYSACLNLLYR